MKGKLSRQSMTSQSLGNIIGRDPNLCRMLSAMHLILIIHFVNPLFILSRETIIQRIGSSQESPQRSYGDVNVQAEITEYFRFLRIYLTAVRKRNFWSHVTLRLRANAESSLHCFLSARRPVMSAKKNPTTRRLASSVVKFLQDSQKNGSLDSEDAESMEVAVGIISEAFGLDTNPADPVNLQQVFDVYEKTREKMVSPIQYQS
jgi:Homodimerisation domain of SGTA